MEKQEQNEGSVLYKLRLTHQKSIFKLLSDSMDDFSLALNKAIKHIQGREDDAASNPEGAHGTHNKEQCRSVLTDLTWTLTNLLSYGREYQQELAKGMYADKGKIHEQWYQQFEEKTVILHNKIAGHVDTLQETCKDPQINVPYQPAEIVIEAQRALTNKEIAHEGWKHVSVPYIHTVLLLMQWTQDFLDSLVSIETDNAPETPVLEVESTPVLSGEEKTILAMDILNKRGTFDKNRTMYLFAGIYYSLIEVKGLVMTPKEFCMILGKTSIDKDKIPSDKYIGNMSFGGTFPHWVVDNERGAKTEYIIDVAKEFLKILDSL